MTTENDELIKRLWELRDDQMRVAHDIGRDTGRDSKHTANWKYAEACGLAIEALKIRPIESAAAQPASAKPPWTICPDCGYDIARVSAAVPICMCGDSATLGVVHRTDGPCYYSSLWASASQPSEPTTTDDCVMDKIEHELKCWPGPYDAIADGRKLFEYRKNDRDYEVGDVLYLRRFQPVGNFYTGASMRMVITYVLRAGFGVPDGYAVLGLSSLAAGVAQPASAKPLTDAQYYLRRALEWIDALPKDLVLPAMPGFDRDEANEAAHGIKEQP